LNSPFTDLPTSNLIAAFINGLAFDLAIAGLIMLLLLIPFWLISRFASNLGAYTRFIYFFVAALVLTQTSDTLYFADAGRHVSYEIRDVFNDASSLFLTAIEQHSVFIIIAIVLSLFTTVFVFKLSLKLSKWLFNTLNATFVQKIIQHEVAFLFLFFISIVCIHGGITGVPQEPLTAFISGNTAEGQITLNGAYNISHRLLSNNGRVTKINIPLPKNLTPQQILNQQDTNATPKTIEGDSNAYNVVFVFLESWQAAQMKSYGGDEDVTPFFDSLRAQAISPHYVYSGGGRTTEGLFASLCSYQNPLGQTIAQSQLQSFDYLCLPHILKNKGWETAFFQGSNKNTSGTGIFAQRLGFEKSLGKSSITHPKFKFNKWGAQDPDLYDFVLEQTQTMQEPFFVGINTTTTHDDELPDSIKPQFGMDTAMERYNSTLNFADQALKDFLTQYQLVKHSKPTIFVLLSDHTAGKFRNDFTKALIAGIIYSPDLGLKQTLKRSVHHRDFAPTLLSLLNINSPNSFAGNSMLEPRHTLWDAEYYSSGHLLVTKDDTLINVNLISQQQHCFNLNYPLLKTISKQCSEENTAMANSALGFTHYSQDLLFNGKTTQFWHLKNDDR